MKKNWTLHWGWHSTEQAAKGGCGASLSGDFQNRLGGAPVSPALDNPALARWFSEVLPKPNSSVIRWFGQEFNVAQHWKYYLGENPEINRGITRWIDSL